jgi:hypothetical protein
MGENGSTLRVRFVETDAWQVHAAGRKDVTPEGVRVAPALELLKALV